MKRFLRLLILLSVRLLGWPGIRRGARARERPVKILLVRPDHLGDLILTTPSTPGASG